MVGQQRSRKVMLVEDFKVDRQIYRRYLQADCEHQYSFVESEAEEALTIPDSDWTEIDIVLLDYQLPEIDGIDWLTQWQQQYQHLNLPPAIALTGQGNENIAVEFIKLGAADYIVKNQLTPERLQLALAKFKLIRWRSVICDKIVELFGLI